MAGVTTNGARATGGRRVGAVTAIIAVMLGALIGSPAAASATSSVATAASVTSTALPGSPVVAAPVVGFQAGNIVSDAVFFAKGTMTEAQIQAFLVAKVPSCQSGYTCLKDWYDTSRTTSADAMCGAYSGGVRERASRIIYKVAQACGINPQVLLVMLQKEQGLVTHVWPSEWRYTIAMGQGCPDTAACDTRYYGFFNQVYGAAWQLKRYANPPGTSQFFTWYAPGKTWNVRWHPNASCGSAPVYIQNQATANLYYYTPYQPNAAALKAGYGEGDACSAYGNRNFHNYFTEWFGSTQGGPCVVPSGSVTASWTYTVIRSTTARVAPDSECATDASAIAAGTVGKAVAASADLEWRKIRTESGERWLPAADLRQATPQEAPCAVSEVASAAWTYVLTTDSTARIVPSAGCESDSVHLAAGAVVKSVATSADGQWRRVRMEDRERWLPFEVLRRANSAEAACVLTPGVRASWTYTVTAATTARVAPNAGCASGAIEFAAGTIARAVAASADLEWRKLRTMAGDLWVPADAVRRSTSGEASCAQPVGTVPATWTYVVASTTTGRAAPSTGCASGQSTVEAGTIATSIAASADSAWQLLQTESGPYWVERSAIRRADPAEAACAESVDTVGASWRYVTTTDATARLTPAEDCAVGAESVTAGTVVPAVAASSDLRWRKVRTVLGDRWILASQLRRATSADLVCLPPASSVVSRWTFVVLVQTVGRIAPDGRCDEGSTQLAAGLVAKAVAVSVDGKWRKLRTTAGDLWVPQADIHHVRMTTTAAVNLRSGPSTATTVITTLRKGTDVIVVDVSGLWRKVTVGTRTGWVRGDFLD